jgi:hypothetical protein
MLMPRRVLVRRAHETVLEDEDERVDGHKMGVLKRLHQLQRALLRVARALTSYPIVP